MNRTEKIGLLLATDELDRRRRHAPLIHQKFHARQQQFLDVALAKRVAIVVAGNRWGKTSAGAALAIAHAYGYMPWAVPNLTLDSRGDYPPRSRIPPEYWIRRPDRAPLCIPNRGAIITGLKSDVGIGLVAWPKLQEFLPAAVRQAQTLQVRRTSAGIPSYAKLPDGSEIWFFSGEMAPKEMEGSSFDWVWNDEPIPRSFWIPIWRSLTDHFGRIWITMTGVTPNAPWYKTELVDSGRKDVGIVEGSIFDNIFLDEGARDEFVNTPMDEEDRQARVHGGWAFQSHLAFPSADPAAHRISPREIPQDWPRILSCDPAHRRPYALVWLARGPDREALIYNEWPKEPYHAMRSSGLSVRDYAAIIRHEEGVRPTDLRVMDPRFGPAHTPVHGMVQPSVVELFEDQGIYFSTDIDNIAREEDGIALIRELMAWDSKAPISALNQPRLRVFDGCENTWMALKNSHFVPPNARDTQVLPEKLRETHKDFRDALRYGLLAGYPIIARHGLERGYISQEDLERENNRPEGW